MTLVHEKGRSLGAAWAGNELFRYVYGPWEPQIESPRPYFHPVRTLGGLRVSIYRPYDHVWHKGISWAVCNLGPDNYWGGPTYLPDVGYQQLDNNGVIRHEQFDAVDLGEDSVRFDERLSWITPHGKRCLAERRRIAAKVRPVPRADFDAPAGAWQLAFETSMTNVSDDTLVFGSPTTRGRPDAGYGGLMWRGPRSFTDGKLIAPSGVGGDELMGSRGAWLALAGRHDGHGTAATLVFCDSASNFCFPTRWFARLNPFAGICPAPFFSEERPLAPGASLTLRYDVFVADGGLGVAQCAELASSADRIDLLAPVPGADQAATPSKAEL
jgi:hypothetical protein